MLNPDNDTVSLMYAYTDPTTFEVTLEVENDAFVYTDSKPSSVTRIDDMVFVTYADTDKFRLSRVGWWGTMPWTTWGGGFSYGDRPVASVGHGNFVYVALYNSGEIAKIDLTQRRIVSRLYVGPKPKAMALTQDGSRLLVTRFISHQDYGEVYDIQTAGAMSFRDPEQPSIRIHKVLVPDDIDHGSGVPNYLRSIVIGPNDEYAYVTANKANIDRGQFLNGQALDDDNTIRPMVAVLDLVNHRDTNIDPTTREGTIDLDNNADPAGVTILPDGVTRAYSLQGNNVVEFENPERNIVMRASTGAAPQDMCATARTLYVKNYTDRTISAIDISGFMHDGRQRPTVDSYVTVPAQDEVKTAQELRGLQVFYHARSPDMSPEGYISCASCHEDGGHDGMTWDLTHMGEGLRNTLSLRGTSGTRFGNLHWSSNFDEVQDFEVQLEHLNGGEGLIAGLTFTESHSPLTETTSGLSEDLDALAAYVSSLGKASVMRSPDSCEWGGPCHPDHHGGRRIFGENGCADCHTGAAFRDGLSHDVGTIKASSGSRLGSALTEIRTPTLIELWDTAPYLHDGSAATLAEVFSTGAHANMGLEPGEIPRLVRYLQNLDQLDFIGDAVEPVNTPPVAVADEGVTTAGRALSFTVAQLMANDSDAQDDTLRIIAAGHANHGEVMLDTQAGSLVFTPAVGFVGEASFEYTLSDGTDTATAVVNITVNEELLAWVHCANEGGTCIVPTLAIVRYGANGVYATQANVTGSIACSNGIFGDPIFGVVKTCEYQLSTIDSDNDGVFDHDDAFPNDPTETTDTDGDGVGDNADVFPGDPTETLDSDGDGQGDNSDPFPNDPNNGANPVDHNLGEPINRARIIFSGHSLTDAAVPTVRAIAGVNTIDYHDIYPLLSR